MAHWVSLFLHCARVAGHQELYLVSASKYDSPVLFPGFQQIGDYNQPERVTIGEKHVVYDQLKHKITSGQLHTIQHPFSTTICVNNEPAVDVILSFGKKLVLVQCRLWEDAVGLTKWKGDLENLKKFRDKLWYAKNEKQNKTVPGIPKEEDVVFVLMSPSGVEKKVEQYDYELEDEDFFRGTVLIPGTKSNLNEQYKTWMDLVLGPTFAPLIHLLKLQLK